jgi:hypothetical protein
MKIFGMMASTLNMNKGCIQTSKVTGFAKFGAPLYSNSNNIKAPFPS